MKSACYIRALTALAILCLATTTVSAADISDETDSKLSGYERRSPSIDMNAFGARGFGKRGGLDISQFGARGFGKRMDISSFGARGFGKRSLDLSSFGARGFGKRSLDMSAFGARGFGKRSVYGDENDAEEKRLALDLGSMGARGFGKRAPSVDMTEMGARGFGKKRAAAVIDDALKRFYTNRIRPMYY